MPTLPIGNIPSALPPVASAGTPPSLNLLQAVPSTPEISDPRTAAIAEIPKAELDRLALRVFPPKIQTTSVPKPSRPTQSATSINSRASNQATMPDLGRSSSITAAPSSNLPTLSASMSEPIGTIAAATPHEQS
ncbi:MAG: hypothetical protein HC810_03495 [Acaryochloridaceae cyanobacterium RL_2_7]|nr:hypothetical protein [Acaryochloridaceae cyanobacterium RL_2_7]